MPLEYQRYGRNKGTLVNKTYIDGGEYRNKFDSITNNRDVSRVLYAKAKEMLAHRSGTKVEDMYLLDGRTGEVVASVVDQTTDIVERVIYPDTVKRAIQGRTDLITLHTHPAYHQAQQTSIQRFGMVTLYRLYYATMGKFFSMLQMN